jgi:hypothetical protein
MKFSNANESQHEGGAHTNEQNEGQRKGGTSIRNKRINKRMKADRKPARRPEM